MAKVESKYFFTLPKPWLSHFAGVEPNLVLPCLFNRSMVTRSRHDKLRGMRIWKPTKDTIDHKTRRILGFLQSHHGAWNALSPGVPGHSFLGLKSDKVYRFSVGGMRGFSKRYLSACIYKIWPLGPETRVIKASGIFHAVRSSFLSGKSNGKVKTQHVMNWRRP